MYIKRELITFINVTVRVLSLSVQVIDRVLVECFGTGAVKDVIQARWVSETEYTIPTSTLAMAFRVGIQGQTHDGVNFGAHTMATLSGIMT